MAQAVSMCFTVIIYCPDFSEDILQWETYMRKVRCPYQVSCRPIKPRLTTTGADTGVSPGAPLVTTGCDESFQHGGIAEAVTSF